MPVVAAVRAPPSHADSPPPDPVQEGRESARGNNSNVMIYGISIENGKEIRDRKSLSCVFCLIKEKEGVGIG